MSKNQLLTLDVFADEDKVNISIITYMEVLGYRFDIAEEEAYLLHLFNSLPILPVTDTIASLVISYRKQRKIKLPDAILLATARENNCKLVTRNIDDFINLDAQVEIINPFKK